MNYYNTPSHSYSFSGLSFSGGHVSDGRDHTRDLVIKNYDGVEVLVQYCEEREKIHKTGYVKLRPNYLIEEGNGFMIGIFTNVLKIDYEDVTFVISCNGKVKGHEYPPGHVNAGEYMPTSELRAIPEFEKRAKFVEEVLSRTSTLLLI